MKIASNISHFFSLQTLVLLLVGLVLTVLVTVEAAPTHQVKKNGKIIGIASQGFQSAARHQGMPPPPLYPLTEGRELPSIAVWICVCVS
jgi:hypothetical protein